jgi:hypothetical protein
MAPFVQVVAISRSQSVRVGKQVVPEVSMGDTPGINLQTGGFQVPAYIDLNDGASRRDLQRHSALGSFLDLSLSSTITSDLFFSSAVTLTGTASPVTVGTGGVLKSRTYGTLSSNAKLSKVSTSLGAGASIAIPTPSGATRVDTIVCSQDGKFSRIAGTEGGAAPATPAGSIFVGTASITTGGVVTCSTTGQPAA